MNKVKISAEADVSKARKNLKALEKDLLNTKKTAEKTSKATRDVHSAGRGITAGGSRGLSMLGGNGFNIQNGFKGKNGGFDSGSLIRDWATRFSVSEAVSQRIGIGGRGAGLLRAGGPYAAVAAAATLPIWGPMKYAKDNMAGGKEYNQRFNSVSMQLGQIQKNLGGTGYVEGLTKALVDLGTKGKVPLEQLQQSAARLMLAFSGDQQKTEEFVKIIADISAATGHSTDELSDLISKVHALGRAEESMINQLNEKGIPIYKALAEQLGVSVDQVKEMAKQGKITADEFDRALKAAHGISAAGANTRVKDAKYYEEQINEEKKKGSAYMAERNEENAIKEGERRLEREKKRQKDRNLQAYLNQGGENISLLDTIWERAKELGEDYIDFHIRKPIGAGFRLLDRYATDNHNVRTKNLVSDSVARVDLINTNGYKNRIDALARGVGPSIEDAVKALGNGKEDEGIAKLSEAIERSKAAVLKMEYELEDGLQTEENKKVLRERIQKEKEYQKELDKAKELRNKLTAAEAQRLKDEKIAQELQQQLLIKEKEYVTAWNKTHKGRDKWTGKIASEEEALERYQEAMKLIREGRATENIANYVKHFEALSNDVEAKRKDEENKAKAREEFLLSSEAKSDAGAAFKLSYLKMAEEMRKIGFDEKTIEQHGGKLKGETTAKYAEELNKIVESQNAITTNAKRLGMKINFDTAASVGQDYYSCIRGNLVDSVLKTSYERGAWGQGLAIDSYDDTAAQIKEQRKDILKQVQILTEQKAIAEKQLAAIESIDIRAKAL